MWLAGGTSASAMRVERLGDQTRLHLTHEGHEIVTLTDPHALFEPGESLPAEPRNHIHFDAAGARIA